MNRITGYGRGWQEEKATTRIARLRQIMRQPASHMAWLVIFSIYCTVLAAIGFLAAA